MAYTAPSITASSTTFAQFQQDGCTGHLAALVLAQAATLAPTVAPTVAVSGSGGLLAAGTYFLAITETNGIGETTGKETAASFAVTTGQIPTVTFPTLKSGNVARNVYITAPSGASGTEKCYARGITAGTYALSAVAPSNAYASPLPAVNSTSLIFTDAKGLPVDASLELIRHLQTNQADRIWSYLRSFISNFNNPLCPSSHASDELKLRHFHTCVAMLNQLCVEAGALIDANPGHFAVQQDGIGNARTIQVWP